MTIGWWSRSTSRKPSFGSSGSERTGTMTKSMSRRWSMKGEVKPIRSAADHKVALAEVKRLWGSKLGTREGDRLDVLATLIDAYEAEQHPMDPPDPVEAIKFRMEQQGLT